MIPFSKERWMNSAHSITRAARDYEAWLASQVRVVRAALGAKHSLMADDGFSFLGATFYRWATPGFITMNVCGTRCGRMIQFLRTHGAWILRRPSPHCNRAELSQMPRWREQKSRRMMGHGLANVHLGTRGARVRIQADLHRRKPKWLRQSVEKMAEATLADWNEWKRKTA
jgi:hypothetical protein